MPLPMWTAFLCSSRIKDDTLFQYTAVTVMKYKGM